MAASRPDRSREVEAESRRPDFRRSGQRPAPARPRASSSSRPIYFLGLIALVAIVTLLLLVIWPFLQTPVPLVAVALQYHEWPLGPNSLSQEDLDGFDRAFRGYKNVSLLRCEPTKFSAEWLVRQLDTIEAGGPRRLARSRQGIIIYLSGHGAVDERGDACLLLPGQTTVDYLTSDPESNAWLRVADILRALCESEKLRAADKLVVFDVGKMELNWSIGWLHNSFPSALRRAVDAVGDARLAVLCSANDGQRAWTDSGLRASVFGHFFRLGLRGAASGGDRTLTLRELHAYLDEKVSQWVADQFGAQQHPVLMAAPDFDFPVAFAAPDATPRSEPWNVDAAVTDAAAIWDKYARVCEAVWAPRRSANPLEARSFVAAPWSDNPEDFARLQGKLVRFEQMLMAGDAYRLDADQLHGELEKLCDGFLNALAGPGTAGSSRMPLGSLAACGAADVARAESAFKAWEEFRKQPPAEGASAAPPLPPEAQLAWGPACWFAYERACAELSGASGEAWRDRPLRYLQFVDDQADRAAGAMEPAELRLLRWGLSLLEDARAAQGLARAVEVRRCLEDATALSDPRVAYWLAARWDELAARVRRGEDRLFHAGDGWGELAAEWDNLLAPDGRGAIPQCRDVALGLEAAYAARDQARAWLPHLGIWLDYRGRLTQPLPDTDATARLFEMWNEATESAQQLDQLLARGMPLPPPERAALTAEVIERGDKLSESMRPLLDKYNLECAALLRPAENPHWRAQMDAALRSALPAAPRDRRRELFLAFATVHAASDRTDGAAERREAPPDSQVAAAHLDFLVRGRHPALKLLEPSEVAAADEDLAAVGAQLRKVLRERNGMVRQAWAQSDKELSQTPIPEADRARQGWVAADALVRRSAAVAWGDLPSEWNGAVLRSFDRYVQLLRLTRRRLDDFWGASLDSARKPFFEEVSEKLLAAASDERRALLGRVDQVSVYQNQLEDLLRERRGAQFRLDVSTPPELQTTADEVAGQIVLESQGAVPPGSATLFFAPPGAGPPASVPADVQGVLGTRGSLDLAGTPGGSPVRFRLGAAAYDAEVTPTVFFRGRYLTAKLPARQEIRAEVVTFRPRPRQSAKIKVLGQALEASYVMFVLDCSGSMEFPGKPTESGQRRTRLEQARDELPQIVESICGTNPQARLGLILFGHREAELTPKSKTDVETVIDFDAHPRLPGDAADIRDDFARRISNLKPKGETPLFLSIGEAMRRFPRGSQPEQCHVIVLSDGVDLTGGAAHVEVAADLRARVDVFEYELSEKEKLDPRIPPARQRLQAVCEKSGGGYYPDLTSWFDAISSLQQRQKQFTVQGVTDAAWRAAASLGGIVEVGPAQLGGSFRIAVEEPEAVQVTLDGGEQLVLQYEAGQLRFAAWPEVDEKDPLLSLGGRSFRVAALSPLQEGDVRVFRVAMREYEPAGSGRARFTPRPAAIWAEVEAETAAGTILYPATDLDYEPDHPGPVQRLSMPDWRPEVDRAVIRLWFATDVSSPRFVHNARVPAEPIRHEHSTFSSRWDTSAEQPKFIVQQQLDPQAAEPELYQYRVALVAPRAVAVEHRYYRELRKAEHVFTLEARGGGVAAEVPLLQITAKSDFVRAALDEKPVVLPVSLR